jgi:hydroxyacylglutathione hydrolase
LIIIVSLLVAITIFAITLGFVITSDLNYDRVVLATSESWHDDWYTITRLDDQTFAIGEPRYWQRNYSYLIIGSERALLFDTGPGVRDIGPVVSTLTELPVTVLSSHPHYDHIGNNYRFNSVAWIRVPSILSETENDRFQPSYLRGFTTRKIPSFDISEWWEPEQEIDLGQRRLQVFFVPGHEAASFALLDIGRRQLFTGDFIYPGWLVAFAPTSDLNDYLNSVRYLIQMTHGDETLFGAHSVPEHPSPALPHSSLRDLERVLDAISSGRANASATLPIRIYPINPDMEIYLPPF